MFGRLTNPIQNLTQLAGQLQSAKSSLDRIFQVMDEPDEVADVTETLSGDLTGQVSFKNVDFQYVADKPLIRDFNLEVKPGEGGGHCRTNRSRGKQTLINLLMRFYDVTAGSITVDGHDIRHLSRQDYRKQFGWCFRMLGYMREPSKKTFALVISKQRMKKLLKPQRRPMSITLSGRFLVVTIWK